MLSGEPEKPIRLKQFRRKRAWVEEGFIYAGERTDPYDPMEDKNLPNYFARVRTPEDACRFVERYGLLLPDDPYAYLEQFGIRVPETEKKKDVGNREEVSLFLTHAWAVDTALRLAHAVHEQDEAMAASVLGSVRAVALTSGASDQLEEILAGNGRPLLSAAQVLASMINANLRDIGRRLEVVEDIQGNPRLVFRYDVECLLQAIWWHISERAVTDRLRQCLYCGTPFYVTDERMRFCPPEYGQKQSACGDKYRKQLRKRKGKE